MSLPRGMSRRRFLAGAARLAAGLLAGSPPASIAPLRARAQAEPLRVAYVGPVRTGISPVSAATYQVAGEAARKGAIMAGEEFSGIAEMLGRRFEVLTASAPTPAAAVRAAARLMAREGVYGILGGFDPEGCSALADLAEQRGALFLNIGCASDALRHEGCRRHTFHVEASAAMYLDAVADWFVRQGARRWFFVTPDAPEGRARLERARHALAQRHWGGREAGNASVAPGEPEYRPVLEQIREAKPDLVLLLLDGVGQLDFLGQYEEAGLPHRVTGFPEAVAQTRTFFAAARTSAPRTGTGYRATLWEATLDNYGGRELNARFLERWGQPMDPPAWAAWASVKILWEAASFAGTTDPGQLAAYLEGEATLFDVYKGIGVSFRPWDHQLRETVFLVKVQEDASDPLGLAALVGQLPAISRPGFSPNEMLDQIGDAADRSGCSFTG
ncbi:ABC transporter substrate-binding protein [Limnochorda pilosa]|uniref:Leucine-binding protein domain-containing protein n=1 Tax=Limnochorda pilosa TaxID=1555112 RepID=A0A0K2SIP6_LIMPI|nr:ABC transporter substrate-binding protein [Limnochorda pilosa]BAS26983.1 hypothetical protein LIP_1126 [Limnochorda pilosa]